MDLWVSFLNACFPDTVVGCVKSIVLFASTVTFHRHLMHVEHL